MPKYYVWDSDHNFHVIVMRESPRFAAMDMLTEYMSVDAIGSDYMHVSEHGFSDDPATLLFDMDELLEEMCNEEDN